MEMFCDSVCSLFFGGGREKVLNLRTNKLFLNDNDTSVDQGALQSDQLEIPVLSWYCF